MSKVNVFIAYMLKKNENQAFGRVAKEVRFQVACQPNRVFSNSGHYQ